MVKSGKKFFMCGLVPLASGKPGSVPEEKLQALLGSLKKTDKSAKAFLLVFLNWRDERSKCIDEIEQLAMNIDNHHRNISIAQIPTSAVGILGGVLTITGLALIPVTFGASLGLTISGAVMGIGATATGITTSATDIGIQVDRVKKAKACIKNHSDTTAEMVEVMNELLTNCAECDELSSDEAITALLQQTTGECTRTSLSSLKNTASIGVSVIKTIPKAAKSVNLLRRGMGIASASSLRTVDIAADVAAGGATTTGKVLTGLGFAFNAIGIAADLVSTGIAKNDLKKSSIKTSRNIRKVAEDLRKELTFVQKIYDELKDV